MDPLSVSKPVEYFLKTVGFKRLVYYGYIHEKNDKNIEFS